MRAGNGSAAQRVNRGQCAKGPSNVPEKILLVDDEKNVRELVWATLECEQWLLLEAADGQEAVEVALRERPDVIVMDWMMPRLSGIEAARTLRGHPCTASIPIILSTARSQAEDYAAGRAAGVSAYLSKPFSPFELLERVESILGEAPVDGL